MTNIRLLIVADDHLARAGLASLLNDQDSLTVVGQVDSQIDANDLIHLYRADVVLWDLGWEIDSTLEHLARLLQSSSDDGPLNDKRSNDQSSDEKEDLNSATLVVDIPLILVLTSTPEQAPVIWQTGVQGLLLRTTNSDEITTALSAIGQGLLVIDPELSGFLWSTQRMPARSDSSDLVKPLTPRELEVLQLVAEGLPNKTIARQLDISEHTVKFHLNAILGKFNASNRTEAVMRATRAGLIFI